MSDSDMQEFSYPNLPREQESSGKARGTGRLVTQHRLGGRRRFGSGPIGRSLRVLVLVAAIYGMIRWQFEPQYRDFSSALSTRWTEFYYRKEVRIDGLRALRAEDIEVRLPMERSVWWWLWSTTELEALLMRDPVVSEAHVERCELFSLRCFTVLIVEREPVALALVSDQWWVVGRDGAMIGVVSTEARGNSRLPVLLGLGRFETVPLLMGERINAAVALMISLEQLVEQGALPGLLRPQVLTFTADQEILVEAGRASVSSGVSPDASRGVDSRELSSPPRENSSQSWQTAPELLIDLSSSAGVSEQLNRLVEVVAQVSNRIEEVRRIDLALTAQAVVSFRERPVGSHTSSRDGVNN